MYETRFLIGYLEVLKIELYSFLLVIQLLKEPQHAVQNIFPFFYNLILNTFRKFKLTYNMQIIHILKLHTDLHCNCSITDDNGSCMSRTTYSH